MTISNYNIQKQYEKNSKLYSWYFFIAILILSSCNSSKSEKKAIQYGEVTNELVQMLDTNPELKSLYIASIEKAAEAQMNWSKPMNFRAVFSHIL